MCGSVMVAIIGSLVCGSVMVVMVAKYVNVMVATFARCVVV